MKNKLTPWERIKWEVLGVYSPSLSLNQPQLYTSTWRYRWATKRGKKLPALLIIGAEIQSLFEGIMEGMKGS